jgi:hypothetical protein
VAEGRDDDVEEEEEALPMVTGFDRIDGFSVAVDVETVETDEGKEDEERVRST